MGGCCPTRGRHVAPMPVPTTTPASAFAAAPEIAFAVAPEPAFAAAPEPTPAPARPPVPVPNTERVIEVELAHLIEAQGRSYARLRNIQRERADIASELREVRESRERMEREGMGGN